MTTVVNSESGQSILEFLMILPILMGMVVVLIRINTAIQIAIVNQQYSRAQTLFLTFNSPFYPKVSMQKSLVTRNFNQLVIGVSENTTDNQGDTSPVASTQVITRKPTQGADAPQTEPLTRSKVRIRNTVTLCAPTYIVHNGPSGISPVLPLGNEPLFLPIAPSALPEQPHRDYCWSPMKYISGAQ